jgi:hypothetical protein
MPIRIQLNCFFLQILNSTARDILQSQYEYRTHKGKKQIKKKSINRLKLF